MVKVNEERVMNIYDIAKKAGVSIATVSRILNNKGNVKKSTEDKVLAVMQELGYTPNAFARALGLNSIKSVGVLCSDVSDIYYAKAVSVIESELREKGYDVTLYCTGLNIADKKRAMSSLLAKKVDAMILVGSIFQERGDNSHIEEVAKSIPVVIINGEFEYDNTYSIYCAEAKAVEEVVDLLAEKGRRKLIYLYDIDSFSGDKKRNGYISGLEKNGIEYEPERIFKCERNFKSYRDAISAAITSNTNFDAVVCSEDMLAVGAIKELVGRGFRIPDDIAVVGCNNSILAESSSPTITSIDNKVEALCVDTVRTLLDVFAGKDVSHIKKIYGNVVSRESFVI